DGLGPTPHGQLAEDVLRVRLHCLGSDAELTRDHLVGQPMAHQEHDRARAGMPDVSRHMLVSADTKTRRPANGAHVTHLISLPPATASSYDALTHHTSSRLRMHKSIALSAAVEKIPEGASLLIGGFMGIGSPHRLIGELVRQGRKGLTVIA